MGCKYINNDINVVTSSLLSSGAYPDEHDTLLHPRSGACWGQRCPCTRQRSPSPASRELASGRYRHRGGLGRPQPPGPGGRGRSAAGTGCCSGAAPIWSEPGRVGEAGAGSAAMERGAAGPYGEEAMPEVRKGRGVGGRRGCACAARPALGGGNFAACRRQRPPTSRVPSPPRAVRGQRGAARAGAKRCHPVPSIAFPPARARNGGTPLPAFPWPRRRCPRAGVVPGLRGGRCRAAPARTPWPAALPHLPTGSRR